MQATYNSQAARGTKDANDDLDIVWPSDDERARLERILGPYYRATLNAINAILARLLPPDANSMVVSDAAVTRILGEAAARVVRIDQATRAAIQAQLQLGQLRGYSTWQIAHGVEADGYRGIDGLFQETWRGRAECLLPTTPITSATVTAVWRRPYEGDVVQILTRSGRHLTTTPNHPHLTRQGWFAAEQVTPGDYLVRHVGNEQTASARDQNVQTAPPTIAQIFDALAAVGIAQRRPTSQPDFHGDGRQSYVDVLRPKGMLSIGNFAPLYKPVIHQLLSPADLTRTPYCLTCGLLLAINEPVCSCTIAQRNAGVIEMSYDQLFRSLEGAADELDRFSALIPAGDLSQSKVAPSAIFGASVGAPWAHEIAFPQDGAQSVEWRVARTSGFFKRHSAEIELDAVVDVARARWSGHVFNLTTPYGYFCADALYTGNTVARTELQHASVVASHERFVASGVVDRVRIIDGDEWDTTCANRHGTVVPLEQAPTELGHPNCLIGGQLVFAPNWQASSARQYDGEVVVLRTATDDFLTVTPNHPILTTTGWHGAGELAKGDYVVRCLNAERVATVIDPHHHHAPVLIEQVANTVRPATSRATATMPAAAEQFHGDGAGGYVNVVWADGLLRDGNGEVAVEQQVNEVLGIDIGRSFSTGSPFARGCAPAQFVKGAAHSANGVMRSHRQIASFDVVQLAAPSDGALTSWTGDTDAAQPCADGSDVNSKLWRYLHRTQLLSDIQVAKRHLAGETRDTSGVITRPAEVAMQGRTADTNLVRQVVDISPSLIAPVQLIEVKRQSFRGDVYNLQTTQGWFIASNLITHNCTLALIPVLREDL